MGGGGKGGEEVWGVTFETKVAARNGKSLISTISRGKERTVNSLTYLPICLT